MQKFDNFDNSQAYSEGWALFNDGELQRLDLGAYSTEGEQSGDPVFTSDEAALDFVKMKNKEGSLYHAKALEIYQAYLNELVQVKE